jgi:hypothetical protein
VKIREIESGPDTAVRYPTKRLSISAAVFLSDSRARYPAMNRRNSCDSVHYPCNVGLGLMRRSGEPVASALPSGLDAVFIRQNYHDLYDKFMGPADVPEFNKASPP